MLSSWTAMSGRGRRKPRPVAFATASLAVQMERRRSARAADPVRVRDAEVQVACGRGCDELRAPPWWATEAQPGRVGARELGEHRPRQRVRGQVVASRRRRTEACEGRPFVGPENLARARGEDGRVTAS